MGNGRWSATGWSAYARTVTAGKSKAEIFTSRGMKPDYDPSRFRLRESRDSADNPQSTPIILASDVTGSMGMIAEKIMRDGLNTLATEIYARRPVPDPHIMIAAVGDAECDRAPLQVTQFEADIRVARQARELWLEGGGGGNRGESYSIAQLFAALKVSADAIERRGKKGYLFTIGDEPNLDGMTRAQIERYLGVTLERDLSAAEILQMARKNWEVFHVVLVNEGYCRYGRDEVLATWRALLPERTIELQSVDALTLSGNVRYSGSYFSDDDNLSASFVESYTVANTRIAYDLRDNLQLYGYVNNLFDEDAVTYMRASRAVVGGYEATLVEPRMIGIGLKMTF
ncbi:TonB-dependent receptor [Rhodovulum sp. MB263]|uniref:TonB-dependent receptor n=1 Tax=Rhodovulum sp. (strain MB263) TaxID=308754 RepID=UPI0009B75905|nr:TonB-dependent receptor [Rhodovulum sp. MB263]ARC90674.1 hypothetical protein B5V46_18495 [Rhodovulum sp. MB263]